MGRYSGETPANVGTGEKLSMLELAGMACEATGFGGEIRTDPSKPDGMPRRVCGSARLRKMGWRAGVPLREGIRRAYGDFLGQDAEGRED